MPTRAGKGLARPLLFLARERGAFTHGISVLVLGPRVEQGAAVSRVFSAKWPVLGWVLWLPAPSGAVQLWFRVPVAWQDTREERARA